MVVLAVLIGGVIFAADEKGQGEATIAPSVIFTGEALEFGQVWLTFTAKTTNMADGIVYVKIPAAMSSWAPGSAALVTTSGTATEIGPVKHWVEGTTTYMEATCWMQ